MTKLLFKGLLLSVVLAALAWVAVQSYMNSPVDSMTQPLLFEVPEGASLSRVAHRLEEQQVLKWPQVFAVVGRLTGKAHRIQAGEYLLEPGVTLAGILDQLVEGRVKLYAFTILEGWTFREVRAAIANNPAIASTLGEDKVEAAQFLGDAVSGISNPEGWLYPDTYMVPRNTTDIALFRQASALMAEKLNRAWASRADDLPLLSPYELLTLASIIERETAVEAERAQVAGVFIRRLKKGMRLQTDPTVIYGMGEKFNGNITRRDLLTDTPYNTYTRGGLPPTPIGMPGEGSLYAAGHPDDGESLYFVASGDEDGTHVFSSTLEEHNAAVSAYISQLRLANKASKANRAGSAD